MLLQSVTYTHSINDWKWTHDTYKRHICTLDKWMHDTYTRSSTILMVISMLIAHVNLCKMWYRNYDLTLDVWRAHISFPLVLWLTLIFFMCYLSSLSPWFQTLCQKKNDYSVSGAGSRIIVHVAWCVVCVQTRRACGGAEQTRWTPPWN